jgi:predicted DNA-binding protein
MKMEPRKEKVSRSLKLDVQLNERLVKLCEHLGVNPNAYLLNEVGKAISRDELAFVVANNSKNAMTDMMAFLASMSDLPLPESQPESKNP